MSSVEKRKSPDGIATSDVSALMDTYVLDITNLIDAELIHEQTIRHHPNNT